MCSLVTSVPDRIEEADVETQTDAFLDRPPTPLFIPAKTGLDVATQIQDGDVSTLTQLEARGKGSPMIYILLCLAVV